MLCIQLGNGAHARGVCCIAFGDGVVARGAFKVDVRSTVTFPENTSVEDMDTLMAAVTDLNLTYQALVEDGFAPAEFGVRSKAAIDIILDTCTRHRTKLAAAATAAANAAAAQTTTTTVVPVAAVSKGKEELVEVVE